MLNLLPEGETNKNNSNTQIVNNLIIKQMNWKMPRYGCPEKIGSFVFYRFRLKFGLGISSNVDDDKQTPTMRCVEFWIDEPFI